MESYTAWIVNIGNELLIGKTVNTNGAWLARKLTLLGYKVLRIVCIPDSENDVVEIVRLAIKRDVRLLITTGGLGPTFDDRTSEYLAKALNTEWVLNEEAYRIVMETLRARGLEPTEPRIKQAKMPKGAKPIPNIYGTAPGIWIERNKDLGPKMYFAEKILKVEGIMEAEITHILVKGLKMSDRVYIKSHPKGKALLEIHVYASDESEDKAKDVVLKVSEFLINELAKLGAKIEELKT
ncbi:MAG: competence damage-inducible protein A [Thermoprotei archaeon ex4572_64]|nr:MAG: competence damage-inducible protein A [Thermoprotei archaeon ex4572_64]